ncbi:hypothetical protein GIB67_020070 [Kingdonia uniflora]|uniref:Uncharacterized protein n=1 Tax=Kingdonia uniflora TaxID=39325 RepID=A0A7J7L2H1_9MAGN|nr:hypothetical protein GIB67_020070 [Kingdonia uniflora]
MSAQTKMAAEFSIPLDNPDSSRYTTNSVAVKKKALLSGDFRKVGKKKRVATLPLVSALPTRRITHQNPQEKENLGRKEVDAIIPKGGGTMFALGKFLLCRSIRLLA